jgi:hypothetical protein|tara:strand:+ start:166 stop:543 length:378 start_codon:yes stop_codon:yes gene_type:complete
MEINYVLLGIVSSVIVFLLGYAVVVIFNFKNRIDYLESFLEDTDEKIDIVVDKSNQNLTTLLEVLEGKVEGNQKDIIALLDSRLDKLEYKFRADVTSGTEVLKVIEASKKSNERLDEFIRTFQAQ